MNIIKIMHKYYKLEKRHNTNFDLCHIIVLETLLIEPTYWFNYFHFKDYFKRYQFSTTTKALSGSIKDSINNVRIHEKGLHWLDKRTFKFDKRMNEFKISKKGLNDLKSL